MGTSWNPEVHIDRWRKFRNFWYLCSTQARMTYPYPSASLRCCVEIWESLIKLVFFKYLFTLLPRSKWKLLALHWYSRRVLPTPPCSFSFFFLSCFPFALPYALMQFHCQLLTRYHFHSQLTNNYYHHCQHIYPPIGWLGKTINNGSQRLKTNHFFHQSCRRMLLSDNHQCYHQD